MSMETQQFLDYQPNTLVYDRDCDLCRWSQGWVSRWDRHHRIRYLAFQEPLFKQWFPDYPLEGPPRAMFFIDQEKRVWEGFEAFQHLLIHLPFGRMLSVFLSIPGAKWVGIKTYEWIARNRYRFQQTQ